MKVSTIFKYIFIIFVIGIISYSGYRIYNNNNKEEYQNQEESNVAQEEIIRDIRLSLTSYDTMNPLITNNKEIKPAKKDKNNILRCAFIKPSFLVDYYSTKNDF